MLVSCGPCVAEMVHPLLAVASGEGFNCRVVSFVGVCIAPLAVTHMLACPCVPCFCRRSRPRLCPNSPATMLSLPLGLRCALRAGSVWCGALSRSQVFITVCVGCVLGVCWVCVGCVLGVLPCHRRRTCPRCHNLSRWRPKRALALACYTHAWHRRRTLVGWGALQAAAMEPPGVCPQRVTPNPPNQRGWRWRSFF